MSDPHRGEEIRQRIRPIDEQMWKLVGHDVGDRFRGFLRNKAREHYRAHIWSSVYNPIRSAVRQHFLEGIVQ